MGKKKKITNVKKSFEMSEKCARNIFLILMILLLFLSKYNRINKALKIKIPIATAFTLSTPFIIVSEIPFPADSHQLLILYILLIE